MKNDFVWTGCSTIQNDISSELLTKFFHEIIQPNAHEQMIGEMDRDENVSLLTYSGHTYSVPQCLEIVRVSRVLEVYQLHG